MEWNYWVGYDSLLVVVKAMDPFVIEKLKFKKELFAKRYTKPNKVFLVLYGLLASLDEVRGK